MDQGDQMATEVSLVRLETLVIPVPRGLEGNRALTGRWAQRALPEYRDPLASRVRWVNKALKAFQVSRATQAVLEELASLGPGVYLASKAPQGPKVTPALLVSRVTLGREVMSDSLDLSDLQDYLVRRVPSDLLDLGVLKVERGQQETRGQLVPKDLRDSRDLSGPLVQLE